MPDKPNRADDPLADQDTPEQSSDPSPANQPVDPATQESLPESLIPHDLHTPEEAPATPGDKASSGSRLIARLRLAMASSFAPFAAASRLNRKW